MMSAAQRMYAAQRRNENTPEAFAFPGCFSMLPQCPSCAAAHIIFAQQNIICEAKHHLRSNIIYFA